MYLLKLILLPLLICLTMVSCTKDSERTIIDKPITEQRILFPITNSDSLSLTLRGEVQSFVFSTKKDTQFVANSGLLIHIPSNVFVDENNQPVSNVKLTILEASKPVDFIFNNLHTESDGELLESGGMFFINAESGGKQISLKENTALIIQKPTQYQIGNMQVFYGNYNEQGKINWTPVGKSVGVLDNSLISFPLKYIYKDDKKNPFKDLSSFLNRSFNDDILYREYKKLNNPSYEDTYLGTHEFLQRLILLSFGAPLNPDTTVFKQVLDIYTNGVDDDLYKADKKVIKLLTPHAERMFKMLKDSIASDSLKSKNNKKEDSFLSFGIQLRHQMIYNVATVVWDYVNKYPEMKLTKPINFTKLGINNTTTKANLIKEGYSDEDASLLLFYYQQRNKQLEANIEAKKQEENLNYTLSVKKFGWVNIDRFSNDSSAKETDFIVEIPGHDTLKNTRVTLIIPERSMCISNTFFENGEYSFTKKGTSYRKLPIGIEACIVALSTSNGKNYVGIKKFKIPLHGKVTIKMEEGTTEEIKKKITKAL